MKKGDERWSATYYDKLEFDRWVLRTFRDPWGHMVLHVPGVTWVKMSKTHGDFGYVKNVPQFLRCKFLLSGGLPYSATKLGAVADVIAGIRRDIAEYGPGFIEDYHGELDPEPALSVKLQRALTAQKKLRKAR